MKLHPIILPIAQQEFDEAVERYANIKKGLGKKFAKEVRKALKLVRRFPRIHAVVFQDVRRAVVKGFPYVVLYRVTDREIIFLAVFNTSRDPAIWQSRI